MAKFLLTFLAIFLALQNAAHAASQSRSVSGYTGVTAYGGFQVIIQFTGQEGVRLEATDPALLDLVETVVEGSVLAIRYKSNTNVINVPSVQAVVDALHIQSLQTLGDASINVIRPVVEPTIELITKGSSHIVVSVQTQSVTASLMGSGVVDISGTAQTAQLSTKGSSQLNGADLQLDQAQISMQGSGKIEIGVTSSVGGSIMGNGVLRLRGSPTESVRTMGSGRIEHF